MSNSIVVFGPAHVGKSTLIGYSFAKTMNYDMKKFESEARKRYSPHYDPKQKFAYILDNAEDESPAFKEANPQFKLDHHGTSRYMHPRRMLLNRQPFTIIDTPGADSQTRERMRGIVHGEIGVFMAELKMLMEELTKPAKKENEYSHFRLLDLWLSLPGKRKLIICLSKMDELEYSEECFNNVKNEIYKRYDDKREQIEKIIPIAIEVEPAVDHNVFSKSNTMPWYSGQTLFEILQTFINNTSHDDKPLFAYIDKLYTITGIGKVWRVKLLQGQVFKGSTIKIVPVKYEREFASITAKVRDIGFEHGGGADFAENGDIVSLDLSETKMNGKSCDKSAIQKIRTSCIVSSEILMKMGNILRFRIPLEKYNFKPLAQLFVLWFGRLVPCTIVNLDKDTDNGIITLELEKTNAALPFNSNGELIFTKFLLVKQVTEIKKEYIPADLELIGNPGTVTVPINSFPEERIKRRIKQYAYEIVENEVIISSKQSFDLLLRQIRLLENDEEKRTNLLMSTKIDIKDAELV